MSEIYAPGSIAGPQGPAGPAGSQGSVIALASATLPSFVGRNLFDPSKVTAGMQVNAADGTLSACSGGNAETASGLIYCPGATSMIANIAIDPNGAGLAGTGICLYDANGTFISALSTTGMALYNGFTKGYSAFPLPGTQVYVRFSYLARMAGTDNWESDSIAMVYATITGTAALPGWGVYVPYGFATLTDVAAMDTTVATNAASALTTAMATIPTSLELFAQTMLPTGDLNSRNLFDAAKRVGGQVNPDGSVGSGPWAVSTVFAPGATQFITDLDIRGIPNGCGFCLYDAAGNFIEDISTTTLAANWTSSNCLTPGTVFTLPGTQTYIKFCNGGSSFASYGFAQSWASALFMCGNAASPCPTSLPEGAAVTGSSPTQVKTATQLGAANDASKDSAALLNAFLATATSTNPIKLILDGNFAISTGLVIAAAGYTTIEGIGPGSGLAVSAGTNGGIIVGAGQGAYNVTPPTRTAANIVLRNFSVSTTGTSASGLTISDCSNVMIENMTFPGGTALYDFAVTISNANQVFVRGCVFNSTGTGHDGVHLDGKVEDVTISDCYFSTGDDAIALNAPEGYGGDISRVVVTNCRFNGSLTVMRIYTSLDPAALPTNNVHKVRNVVVSNCTGWTTNFCFDLGITNNGLSATLDSDQLQDLSVSNCTFSSPNGLAFMLTPISAATFRGVKFIPTSAVPVFLAWYPIGELTLDDFAVLRNGDGNSAPAALVSCTGGNANIDRLSLLNCRVVDEEGSSYAALPALLDVQGTVAALRLEAVDLAHVTALASSAGWTGVTALLGAGVLGTGAQVPDSVMGNNALYLSSNDSGAPSIKVGGTAKRLTLA